MGKIYGSLINRLEENKNYTNREIKVGDDITMYYWSDRTCYYVTDVIDQKHIKVKEYIILPDYSTGRSMDNNWVYFKSAKEADKYKKQFNKYNPEHKELDNKEKEWVFRYNHWNEKYIGFDKKVHYHRLEPISFGIRDYYYDYEF